MKKKYLYILLFHLLFFSILRLDAQVDSMRAIVFDFEVEIESDENLAINLRTMLEANLDLDFKILNHDNLAKIMKDKKLREDNKSLFDLNTVIQEGKFLEARYSILGKISQIGGTPYISVQLVDNQTTVQLNTHVTLSEIETTKIDTAMKQIAQNLKYKYNNINKYSPVAFTNKTNQPVVIGDNIIEPSDEPIKVYIEPGKNKFSTDKEEGKQFQVNKNVTTEVEFYEENGDIKVSSKKHKLFVSTDAVTFLDIENNWMAELGYYYHVKNGLYLGFSVSGLSVPYSSTYSTFQNIEPTTTTQVSKDYFLNILVRQDYFIEKHLGKTVYGEFNVGASFNNLYPKIQLKGGVELNKWISFELGYQLYQYEQKEVIFNPYGYANDNLVQTWDRRLLFNLKINYEF
jgi:hypothetical protein